MSYPGNGPPAPPDAPVSWWERLRDWCGWMVAAIWATIADAGHTWRNASKPQRGDIAADALISGFLAALCVVHLPGWLAWAGPVFAALFMLASVAGVATLNAERRRMAALLQQHPTGAPRIAEIRCPAGYTHTFSYSDVFGWEEIGPAVHHAE